MGKIRANQFTRRLRRFKRWGLPGSILMMLVGYGVLSAWGFSRVSYRVDWYSVSTERINGIGICAAVLFGAGLLCLILWFLALLLVKAAVPCPVCGSYLWERKSACPHCKGGLDWGNLGAVPNQGRQQGESGARYCQRCGTKAEPGHQYCTVCGEKIINS